MVFPPFLCIMTTLWPETRVPDSWWRRVQAGPEVVVFLFIFIFLIKDDLVTGNTCSRFLTKTSACGTGSGGASSYPRCSPLRWASPVSSSSASSSLSSAERSSLIYCTSVPHPHYRRRIRQKVVADVWCTWMPHKPFEEIFLEEYHGRFFHFPFFRSILAAKCQLFYSSFYSNHPGAKSKISSPKQ